MSLAKEYHIQPSEVDKMMFFEYETFLEEMNIIAKKQQEEAEKQQEQYDSMSKGITPSSVMKNTNSQMKAPKMSMPKINIPKKI